MVNFSATQAPQYSSALTEARSSFLERVKEAQAQEFADLLVHLGLMVNNPLFSDVVFVCNDGVRVRASKVILAARSDVLKSMLMGEMVESRRHEIDLPEISSPELLSVFEFLYTGTVSNYHPGSWRMACELVVASRFFLLPNLESIARKFMLDHIASVALDFPLAASLLTEAVGFRVLYDEPDLSLRELVKILSSNWSGSHIVSDPEQTLYLFLTEAVGLKVLCDEPEVSLKKLVKTLTSNWSESHLVNDSYLVRLSEDALHYLLANTEGNCEDDPVLSFEEYLRFKQVIRWCVYNTECGIAAAEESLLKHITVDEKIEETLVDHTTVDKRMEERLVNDVMVDDEMALSIYRSEEGMIHERFESSMQCVACLEVWSTFQPDEAFRNIAARLLRNVDFRRIHPVLLAKMVEPLKLVASEQILNAFRFHSLRRPQILQRAACHWEHGPSHRAEEPGYVICKVDPQIGSAVMMARMSAPYAIYEWSYCVREMPRSFCELGFICSSGLEVEETSFLRRKLSDLCCARVLWLSVLAEAMINWEYGTFLSLDDRRESSRTDGSQNGGQRGMEGSNCVRQDTWAQLRWVVAATQDTKVVFTLNVHERTCSVTVNGKCFGAVWVNLPRAVAYYPAVCLGTSSRGRVEVELLRGFDIA